MTGRGAGVRRGRADGDYEHSDSADHGSAAPNLD